MSEKSGIKQLLAAFFLAAGCIQAARSDAMTIAQNGAAKAVIVVAGDATEPERYAAAELASFLQQITGASFETSSPPRRRQIAIVSRPRRREISLAGLLDGWLRRRRHYHSHRWRRPDLSRRPASRDALRRLYIPGRQSRLPVVVFNSEHHSQEADD